MEPKITISDLRHRITFGEEVRERDKYGTPIGKMKFEAFASDWAHVSNLHGDEYYTAYGLELDRDVKFTIRYRDDIDEGVGIRFRGQTYNIKFIDNIKYKNKFMEIRASLRE